jgi:cytochrome c oxidase subunit 2
LAPRLSTLPRILRRSLIGAAALALATTAPAAGLEIGPDPHSANADDIAAAYWVMVALAFVLIVAINAVLIAALVRFRERRGAEPARIAAGRGFIRRVALPLGLLALAAFIFGIAITRETRSVEPSGPNGLQASSARTAQVGVTGLPSSLTANAAATAAGEGTGETGAGADPLQINAVAQQWLWRFEYPGEEAPGQGTFSYGELVVPVDTSVLLSIDSTDVTHTWFVPQLGGQVEAVPGSIVQTWFKADETGVFEGASTKFSGTGYPVMQPRVRVVEPAAYEAYIETLRRDLDEAQAVVQDAVAAGEDATPEAEAAPPAEEAAP